MRFIGIDLAWGVKGRTGLCAVEEGRVLDSAIVKTDEEILQWTKSYRVASCLVAIDAPLIVKNPTGRRECERAISRCFGRFHAAAHSSNLGMSAFREGVRAERLTRAMGLDVDPFFPPAVEVRRAIEVYPHPAIVALFGLDSILLYKGKARRSIETRSDAFSELVAHLEGLRTSDPPMDVSHSPRWANLVAGVENPSSGTELSRIEDELDAYLCSYIALYYWTHGTERSRVVGDADRGYIVTPVTDEMARCLDSG